MAVITVSNTGGNWNATTTWVGGVVPIVGDTVNFTATSGPLTVNVSTANLIGIDFTNYVNTITFSQPINTNGTVNLGTGGYTQAGASGLIINGATTISGSTTWSSTIGFTGTTYVITLSNTLNITGQVTFSQTGTLSFSAGVNTFNPTGNLLIANGTTTLPNNINIVNLSAIPSTTSPPIFNTNTINISGNLTLNSSTSGMFFGGTTNLVLNGSGSQTWSHSGTAMQLRNNLTISASGTITISGIVYYNTGILTYTGGTVTTTGTTLNIGASTTLNTSGIPWRDISITAGTQTLTSDLNSEVLRMNNASTVNVDNSGGNVYILESLIKSGVGISQGTASINLIGTGTWTHTAVGVIRNNININTTGTLTIGTNVYYAIGTLTYLSGKINAKNSTFNISSSATLINCHKINFDNIRVNQTSIVTMNEFFSGSPSLVTNIVSNGSNYTIAFQDGFEKIAKFIDIASCTLSKPLQLLVLTKSKRNSTNIGIRYINQSPNGIAKGEPSVNLTTFGAGGLLPDPTNL